MPSSRATTPPSVSWMLVLLVMPPLLWAGNFIVGRGVRDEVSPLMLVFGRHLLACACLLPFCWTTLRRDGHLFWQARGILVRTAVSGMLLFNLLVYVGLQSTSANNALLFNSAIPVLIALLSLVLFKERTKRTQLCGLAISLAGIVVIVSHGRFDELLQLRFASGDLWVLAAVVGFALYSIWLRELPASLNRLGVVCVQCLVITVLLLPAMLWEVATQRSALPDASGMAAIAYVAVGGAIFATLFYAQAVRTVGPARAALCIHLIPVFGACLSAVLLGERIHGYQLIGMALIIGGLLLSAMRPSYGRVPE